MKITTTIEITTANAYEALGLTRHDITTLLPLTFIHDLESCARSHANPKNDLQENSLAAARSIFATACRLLPGSTAILAVYAPGGSEWNRVTVA